MGGRLSLTMRGALIGSSRSPQTPKTRRPAQLRNPFPAKALAADDIPPRRCFAQIAAQPMNLSAGYGD